MVNSKEVAFNYCTRRVANHHLSYQKKTVAKINAHYLYFPVPIKLLSILCQKNCSQNIYQIDTNKIPMICVIYLYPIHYLPVNNNE